MIMRVLPLLLAAVFAPLGAKAQNNVIARLEQASDSEIQALLARFPAADANRDGTLTKEEAITFAKAAMAGGGGKGRSASAGSGPAPTAADAAYGPHERNVLDFWKAEGEGPRPLVIFIHGGGFTGGDKSKWREGGEIPRLLESGISCAAINYRFRKDAPIQEILRDAARAVQFLRTKADEWNLDKTRFAGFGGSAGAGTSLWLATRDDLADPKAEDPVLRESSRLQAAVLVATQATYDLTKWESFLGPADPAWWSSPNEAAEFYHFTVQADLAKPEAQPILRECDMLAWISKEDAPVFINNRGPEGPSQNRGHYLHHPEHARQIEKACSAAGVKCTLAGDGKNDPLAFLLETFRGTGAE
jgi:acetyl esterase/lipase